MLRAAAVVFIKIFRRRADQTFPAGILYRRNDGGEGFVQDVVSFGTCPLHWKVDEFLREKNPVPERRLRIPPKNWYLHVKKPWTTAEKPYIRVPAEDIFRFHTQVPLRLQGLQRGPERDFILNLLPILRAVDSTNDF
jgi:hypothetical protein